MNTGDIVTIGGKKATLINPISPSGMKNGQLWEIKIEGLPCNVFRWTSDFDSETHIVDKHEAILKNLKKQEFTGL